MKQFNQPFKVLLFFTIYCFGLFISINTIPTTGFQTVEQNQQQKQYNSSVANILAVHTQQSKDALSDVIEYLTPNFKVFNNNFESFSYSNELFLKTKFNQYQHFIKSLRLKSRKINLLFPFHNFW